VVQSFLDDLRSISVQVLSTFELDGPGIGNISSGILGISFGTSGSKANTYLHTTEQHFKK
jgi:hypothetical protein